MAGLRRLFVAVDPGDETRHRLAELINATLTALPGAVVPPANWHLTLRFVGSATEAEEDRLRYELSEAVMPPPFRIRLGGLGAFPRPARASVLWMGVQEGASQLGDLAAGVETAVQAAGFEQEDRPFRAHLTLSRMRPTVDVTALVDGGFDAQVTLEVESVVLFASVLGRGGARYEAVDRFPL